LSELYTLPEGWEWKEWENIVNVKNGKHYKDVLNPDGKYPIYGSGGIMNYADEYLCNENTTIIGRKGTINSPIFVKEKFWNIDTAFGLEAKRDSLNRFFLYYFSLHFNFLTLNKSTTLPSLAKSNLQKILMPLPPLQEQKRIVSKLDTLFEKIDKAIALHQKNMDEADVFMGSVLNEVFGELEEKYKIVKIEDIAIIKGGKRLPKGNKLTEQETDYPYIRVADFLDIGTVNKESIQYITKDIFEQIKNYTITSKDLYISIAGTIGKTGIIPKELDGANLTENAAKLVYKEDVISNRYIYFLTNSTQFEKQIGLATKTVAQPKLALSRLSKVELPIPPFKTQQKTVKYLDQISEKTEKLKQVQKEKMESLKALKASILDRAFRGEL